MQRRGTYSVSESANVLLDWKKCYSSAVCGTLRLLLLRLYLPAGCWQAPRELQVSSLYSNLSPGLYSKARLGGEEHGGDGYLDPKTPGY